ncbi:MAG: Maf family protein [Vicinamibacterales bacterium]
MRLVLASASPRRAELLTAAGFAFEVLAVDVDERVRPGEAASEYVRRLAIEKASVALARLTLSAEPGEDAQDPNQTRHQVQPSNLGGHSENVGLLVVVGADTAVVVGDEILGKPVGPIDAERMLRLLSGRRHSVLTGVCVLCRHAAADSVDETQVLVNSLSDEQIAWYVASGEGVDKAGAYAIQGLASRFISGIDGSYSNVVGLPVATVDRLIRTVVTASGVLASGG